jgi:TPR repeat protein
MQNYWYRRAATYDMDLAELDFARDLLRGDGIQKDAIEACAWLTIANPQLNSAGGMLAQVTEKAPPEMLDKIKSRVEALRRIRQASGGYYEDSDSYSTAAPNIALLRQGAASGNPFAEMRLAFALEKGQGIAIDSDAAIQLYEHIQKTGAMELHAWLGTALANGDGLPQDYALARQRLIEASEEGSIPARKTLAKLDLEGKGVRQSLINAYMWLDLADSDAEALKDLTKLATKMSPEEIKQGQSLAADWRLKHRTISP